MNNPRRGGRCLFYGLLALVLFPVCALLVYYGPRPLPLEQQRQLYPGVTYFRSVRFQPRPMIIHAIRVDLTSPDIEFLVTPGDPKAEQPLEAQTVSAFLNQYDLQVAVNGDGFTPWYYNPPFDFYPHTGNPVTPLGFAASQGSDYAKGIEDEVTLYISKDNKVTFNEPDGQVYNAISGDRIVLSKGDPASGLPEDDRPQPRSAVGIDRDGETLLLLVVDGRQPFYSEGATLAELGEILAGYGMHTALNLDGGGSSTLAVEGWFGFADVINSPIDLNIPGRQRPVGNHLGIWVRSQK